jgi:hypothetical protein
MYSTYRRRVRNSNDAIRFLRQRLVIDRRRSTVGQTDRTPRRRWGRSLVASDGRRCGSCLDSRCRQRALAAWPKCRNNDDVNSNFRGHWWRQKRMSPGLWRSLGGNSIDGVSVIRSACRTCGYSIRADGPCVRTHRSNVDNNFFYLMKK